MARGTGEKREAILKLLAEGLPFEEIALRTGTKKSYVTKVAAMARRGGATPKPPAPKKDELEALKAEIAAVKEALSALTEKQGISIENAGFLSEGEKKLSFWATLFADVASKLGVKTGKEMTPMDYLKAFTKFYSDIASDIYSLEKVMLDVTKKRSELGTSKIVYIPSKEGKKGKITLSEEELNQLVQRMAEARVEEILEERKRIAEEEGERRAEA